MHRVYALVLFTIGAGISMLMIGQKSYGEDLKALQANLPDRLMDWTREGEDRFFDDQTIFDYIDGAGEVYRAYHRIELIPLGWQESLLVE